MIRKLYPGGKRKAFNVTYDDGVLQDVRFVELLNRYGLRGTFNLNSGLMESGFVWQHACGLAVQRLRPEAAAALYAGHEVASHTRTHPYMAGLSREEILGEMAEDKAALERLFGRRVEGFAVPFDYYSDAVEACARACGFSYARISEESGSFSPPRERFRWRATVFHSCDGLEELTSRFLETDEELALFQIVGHSYDLDVENRWEQMESLFRLIGGQRDILPMTTAEAVAYLEAMDKAEQTDRFLINRSDTALWFAVDGTVREVEPHGQLALGLPETMDVNGND